MNIFRMYSYLYSRRKEMNTICTWAGIQTTLILVSLAQYFISLIQYSSALEYNITGQVVGSHIVCVRTRMIVVIVSFETEFPNATKLVTYIPGTRCSLEVNGCG